MTSLNVLFLVIILNGTFAVEKISLEVAGWPFVEGGCRVPARERDFVIARIRRAQ